MLAYLVGNEGGVVGTEVNSVLAELGKDKVEKFGYNNVDCFLVSDNDYLVDYQQHFDVIIVSAGLEFANDNTEILSGRLYWETIDPEVSFVPLVMK